MNNEVRSESSVKCGYCDRPQDERGHINHWPDCAGLRTVTISRLRLDWLRAHPESVAYEFPPFNGRTS